jgi:hypothetical protein
MEIGKPKRKYTIEPIRDPVPQRQREPRPDTPASPPGRPQEPVRQ